MALAKKDLVIGEKYNWFAAPERLVYLGYNWSSNGYWYQFALVESPTEVWAECLICDLDYLVKTTEE